MASGAIGRHFDHAADELRQRPFARRTCNRDDGDQGEALVSIDGWITHRDAGAQAALLVAKRGIAFDQDDGAARESHARPFVQPCPSTQ